MKIILWGAAILLAYSAYKKQTIMQTVQSVLTAGQAPSAAAPNLSITNQSPVFGSESSQGVPGSPGTPAGSICQLNRYIRQNESGGPYLGLRIAI
ncbi:MAG TPA: hypothetical protein VGY31_03500 [Terriglobia bacterium]|nr:hypothetical protein [Terriglobia bacterium]